MDLIPSIDLRGGRVVRLHQGDDRRQKDYRLDAEAVLEEYAAAGVRFVHLVDLDAAFGEPPQRELVARLARSSRVRLELGGGLRDREAVRAALAAGCARVVLGSLVVQDFPAFTALAEELPEQIVPAIEVAGGKVRIAGWREAAELSPAELCRRLRGLPCPAVLVTDVERDGTMAGPNLELARRVAVTSGLPALVSGGVRSLADLEAAAAVGEIGGVIVGKALYEGIFTVAQALAVCRAKEALP